MMLKNQLNSLKKNPNMSIETYLSKFKDIKDSLSNIGHDVLDQELTCILIQGLDHSFDNFVMTITLKKKFPRFSKFCELLVLENQRREYSNPSISKPDQDLAIKRGTKKKKARNESQGGNSKLTRIEKRSKSPCLRIF